MLSGRILGALRALLAGIVLLSMTAAAKAETGCARAGEGTAVTVRQESGRAEVEISRQRGAGQNVEVEYNDDIYAARLNTEGRARIAFALLGKENRFLVRLRESAPVICTADAPDFDKQFRLVLIWRDPVALDLHVIEPGRRMGEFGAVSAARRNLDLAQGIGRMDVVLPVLADGASGQLSYVVENPTENIRTRLFNLRLEYLSRGETPAPPHCGEHPLDNVSAQLIILDRGRVEQRNYGTGRALCGEPIDPERRTMPMRH